MFKYAITPEQYMEMTVHLMKLRSRKTSSVIRLILFTAGQMAAVGYLVLRPGPASMILRVLMAVFSLLWAARTVFRFGFFKTRAKMALNMQRRDDPSGEFWKEHHLSRRGNLLSVSYGSQKADIPCSRITGMSESENLTFLMSGNSIIELIPKTVTEREDWKAFWKDLRETGRKTGRSDQDARRAGALSEALFRANIRMDEETLVDHLVAMKRRSYRFFSGWTPASVAIFLLPLILASYALTDGSFLYAAVCLVIFFLLNAGQLAVFTPLYRKIVKNRLKKPEQDGYLLAVTGEMILLFTEDGYFEFARDKIRHVVKMPDASYYYFPGQQMVFVPAEHRDAFEKALRSTPGE